MTLSDTCVDLQRARYQSLSILTQQSKMRQVIVRGCVDDKLRTVQPVINKIDDGHYR